jgi:hypothetical protein
MNSLDSLNLYLKKCIGPKGPNEFVESDTFDENAFSSLVQDGFYISKQPPSSTVKNVEYVKFADHFIIKKCDRSLDWFNENTNKTTFTESREPIYRRIIPPPCETVDHVLVIKHFLETLKKEQGYCNYIEYGVRDGHSLGKLSQVSDKSYGIDIERHKKLTVPSNSEFHLMTTDKFSSEKLGDIKFNAAFIDADHSFTSAYRDFRNIFKHIQPKGYIFLHDTYPCNSMLLKKHFCNDCYKTPLQIKKDYTLKELEILTFPLNPGVTVVRKL